MLMKPSVIYVRETNVQAANGIPSINAPLFLQTIIRRFSPAPRRGKAEAMISWLRKQNEEYAGWSVFPRGTI